MGVHEGAREELLGRIVPLDETLHADAVAPFDELLDVGFRPGGQTRGAPSVTGWGRSTGGGRRRGGSAGVVPCVPGDQFLSDRLGFAESKELLKDELFILVGRHRPFVQHSARGILHQNMKQNIKLMKDPPFWISTDGHVGFKTFMNEDGRSAFDHSVDVWLQRDHMQYSCYTVCSACRQCSDNAIQT